ncbi:MAG: FMN-binding protein [Actinobacteria bacterium]|nr:FMN-binding protein [Actinomycetota bacterium]
MAGLARRLAPAAALGGLAVIIVGVADPAIAGRDDATAAGTTEQTATATLDSGTATSPDTATQPDTTTVPDVTTQPDTTAQAASSCDTAEAVTGPSVMTRWGPVQVAATIADGQLCEVHAVVWPTGDGRSMQINDYAIPIIDAAASQVGTQFDYVSGATYTSEGYRESLQQLLDSL